MQSKNCQKFRSKFGGNEHTTMLLLKGNLTLGERSVIRAPDIYFNVKNQLIQIQYVRLIADQGVQFPSGKWHMEKGLHHLTPTWQS